MQFVRPYGLAKLDFVSLPIVSITSDKTGLLGQAANKTAHSKENKMCFILRVLFVASVTDEATVGTEGVGAG